MRDVIVCIKGIRGDGSVPYPVSINFNILVVILGYSFARGCHW